MKIKIISSAVFFILKVEAKSDSPNYMKKMLTDMAVYFEGQGHSYDEDYF
jgi:hypothetical protein